MRTSDCIDDAVLAAWARGAVPPDEAAALRDHVSGCSTCRTVLAEVARTSGQRPPPEHLGRYRVTERVGSGGMGVVFAAWDPVVERQVAVKVLHDAPADGPERALRFVQERQVLASLDHPHIARLLDAGETDAGQQWFAMEFVDGQPIDTWCDAHALSLRQRLELMLPVFDAVSAAHQRLVVHRDLKPGNILVDAAGKPRLMDFGIARLLEGAAGLTQTGLVPMTPAYASPEQVRREPAAVTSDVYSLGVVLYELVSGLSPYPAEPGIQVLLDAIQRADPEPPSRALDRAPPALQAARGRAERALSADVDAIVLMALRKEPGDRYPTVQALAEDVRAALEGLPTRARRGDRAYRASRFVRRHKVLVAGVTAAFVALSAGLVATLWQARRAEHQRDLAARRFDQVRSLAHAVLFDYHDGVADLPGSTPLRKRLVSDAQAYLEALSAEARDDLGLRRELAAAYLKLGDVQGDPFGASLGDTSAAKRSYLAGRQLAQSVLAEQPADFEARRVVASSHEKVGAIHEVAGALPDALAAYDQARALDAVLLAERPGDVDQRVTVSRDDLAAGQVLLQLGDVKGATERLERSLAERREVLSQRPEPKSRRGVAVVLLSLVSVQQEQGKLDDAVAKAEEAERIFEGLVAELPDAADPRRGLAQARMALASTYRLQQQPAKAVAVAQKSVTQAREAARADPENAVAQRDLMAALANLGGALAVSRDYQALRPLEDEALALLDRLRAADPQNVQVLRDQAWWLTTAANGALERGELAVAEARFRQVGALAAQALAKTGDSSAFEEEPTLAHEGVAAVRAAQGRLDEALAENRLAQQGLAALLQRHPDLKRLQNRLAISMATEGEYRVKQARALKGASAGPSWQRAAGVLRGALDVFAKLEAEDALTGTAAQPRDETKALLRECEAALAGP